MRHIWFVPTPSFKRSNYINLIVRHPILDLGCTFYSFNPKLWWKILKLQNTSSHVLEASILSLSHTILLRCVRNRVFYLHTYVFTIINELGLDIFTTIIRYEDLEFPPRLVLNQGLENIEVVRNCWNILNPLIT